MRTFGAQCFKKFPRTVKVLSLLHNKYRRPRERQRQNRFGQDISSQTQSLSASTLPSSLHSFNVTTSPKWPRFCSSSCSSWLSSAPVSPWTSTPRNAPKSTGGRATAAEEPQRGAGGWRPCGTTAEFRAASVVTAVGLPVFAAVRTKEPYSIR